MTPYQQGEAAAKADLATGQRTDNPYWAEAQLMQWIQFEQGYIGEWERQDNPTMERTHEAD